MMHGFTRLVILLRPYSVVLCLCAEFCDADILILSSISTLSAVIFSGADAGRKDISLFALHSLEFFFRCIAL